jgi:transposase-like protein
MPCDVHQPVLPRYRHSAEIIAQAVRLYYCFPLSYRGVEELLFGLRQLSAHGWRACPAPGILGH